MFERFHLKMPDGDCAETANINMSFERLSKVLTISFLNTKSLTIEHHNKDHLRC